MEFGSLYASLVVFALAGAIRLFKYYVTQKPLGRTHFNYAKYKAVQLFTLGGAFIFLIAFLFENFYR
jgi:hypothetical protein